MVSSGRYTHIDGKVHHRVPFGCYKIGQVASGKEIKFITNDVKNEPRVHDNVWAREFGLVSFAGYRLLSAKSEPIGVLALFSQNLISPEEDALLESLANTTAQVIQTAKLEGSLRESEQTARALLNASPDAALLLDNQGRILALNEQAKRILGKSMQELTGACIFDFFSS